MTELIRWVTYTTRNSYIKFCSDGGTKLNHKKFEMQVVSVLREEVWKAASDRTQQ